MTPELLKILARIRDNDIDFLVLKKSDKVAAEDLEAILKALQANTSVKQITFNNIAIDAKNAQFLAEVLRVNKSIKYLTLNSNSLGDEGVEFLAARLAENISLKHLGIHSNKIGDKGAEFLGAALGANRSLRNLDLRFNDIADDGVCFLANGLEKNNSLIDFSIANNQVKARGAEALARALTRNKILKVLELMNNQIKDDGAAFLAAGLMQNNSLKTLGLCDNGVGDVGAMSFAEFLVNASLTSLDISSNKVTARGAQAIGEALRQNSRLQTLTFGSNKIGDEGALAIVNALTIDSALTTLDIRYNNIGALGAEEVLASLREKKTITFLDFAGNQNEESEGAKRVVKAMKEAVKHNKEVEDSLLDYAKSILAVKLFRSISDNPNEAIAEFDSKALDRRLTTITRKILFSEIPSVQIDEFSAHWHSANCQNVSQKLKDYDNISWPSLFATKALDIPSEIVGAGWKLVARTSPAELKDEGKDLAHCVGGYAGKCINENCHIISVMNEEGKSISTIEIEADYANDRLKIIQHRGRGNQDPSPESAKIADWFLKEVASGKIAIDYKNLATQKQARVSDAKTIRAKATRYIGFNPFGKDEFRNVVKSFKNPITPPFLRENFDRLLNVTEIDLGDLVIAGKTQFDLTEKKPVVAKEAKQIKAPEQYWLPKIQESFNLLFGADAVKISFVMRDPKYPHGEIVVTSNNSEKTESIKEMLLAEMPVLRGKMEGEGDSFIINFQPKPMQEILSKVIANPRNVFVRRSDALSTARLVERVLENIK